MLVLTRKAKQQIQIGPHITITILQIKGQAVRVGVEAPREVCVSAHRNRRKIRRRSTAIPPSRPPWTRPTARRRYLRGLMTKTGPAKPSPRTTNRCDAGLLASMMHHRVRLTSRRARHRFCVLAVGDWPSDNALSSWGARRDPPMTQSRRF